MAKCRYYRMCWLRLGYDEVKWNPDCRGGGDEGCKRFEPMPNVRSLRALADELDTCTVERLNHLGEADRLTGREYARRIRDALGVER